VEDILFLGVMGVVIGGRLGYCLFYKPGYYATHPLEIFAVWQGGMSFHGGMLGVMAAMAWFARSRHRSFLQVMDFVAPCVPTGLASGRVGNFINGELWGARRRPLAALGDDLSAEWQRHAAAPIAGLPVPARRPAAVRAVCGWYGQQGARDRARSRVHAFLIGYGFFRFVAEYFREPDAFLGLLALGMSMGQWLCVPMILAGAGLWWWFGQRAQAADGHSG
jgi:phosphatidylglycerol:prolipoprotein diacylglycerol transferase